MARRVGIALLFLLVGCDGASIQLAVDVRSDLAPGDEVTRVRVEVRSAESDALLGDGEVALGRDSTLFDGIRVTQVTGLSAGPVRVIVELFDSGGEVRGSGRAVVELRESRIVTIVISRGCAGTVCPGPGDDAAATTCFAGRCVEPTCVPGVDDTRCPEPECEDDGACPALSACSRAACVAGACLYAAEHERCPGARCDITQGCVGDADGGVDAGVPDAGPTFTLTGPLARAEVVYLFDEGSGDPRDVSGRTPALDLALDDSGSWTWVPGGLRIDGAALAQSAPASRLATACREAGHVSVEGWVTAGLPLQDGPARILALTGGSAAQAFVFGQGRGPVGRGDGDHYSARVSTSEGAATGSDNAVQTADGTATTDAPAHVVATFSLSTGERCIYEGGSREYCSPLGAGDFSLWNDAFVLALGNELTRDRPWLGTVHRLAVWCELLTAGDVALLFSLGADPELE